MKNEWFFNLTNLQRIKKHLQHLKHWKNSIQRVTVIIIIIILSVIFSFVFIWFFYLIFSWVSCCPLRHRTHTGLSSPPMKLTPYLHRTRAAKYSRTHYNQWRCFTSYFSFWMTSTCLGLCDFIYDFSLPFHTPIHLPFKVTSFGCLLFYLFSFSAEALHTLRTTV